MILLCLALCISACGALCLGLPRHFEQVFKRKPQPWQRYPLRITGWLLLALAIWSASTALGVAIGLVCWSLALTVAAIGQAWLLTYQPRLMLPLSLLAPPASLLLIYL